MRPDYPISKRFYMTVKHFGQSLVSDSFGSVPDTFKRHEE